MLFSVSFVAVVFYQLLNKWICIADDNDNDIWYISYGYSYYTFKTETTSEYKKSSAVKKLVQAVCVDVC